MNLEIKNPTENYDSVKSWVSGFWNAVTKRKFIFPVFSMLKECRNIGVFSKPRVVSRPCAKNMIFRFLCQYCKAHIRKSDSIEIQKNDKSQKHDWVTVFLNHFRRGRENTQHLVFFLLQNEAKTELQLPNLNKCLFIWTSSISANSISAY